jgi:protein tyrosine/serine phosphatase
MQHKHLPLWIAVASCALSLALPASPASLELPGIPNFHQVNEHVFRSGQPADGSWQDLAKFGVKIVIDLRRPDEHSTGAEAQAVAAAGMQYVNVPMKGVVAPSPEEMAKLLSILDSPDKVLVHCHRGADRTGAVIACYRISHDHWQNQQALQEAKSLGMRWTQMGLKRFILSFQPSTAARRSPPEDARL